MQNTHPIAAPEVIIVEDDIDSVKCDGGTGALGHPTVWLAFNGRDMVECGYCDRQFVRQRSVHEIMRKQN